MSKPVKSNDPIKKPVVTLLKEKSGADRVTCVTFSEPNIYSGNCFRHVGNKKYQPLGTFQVQLTVKDYDPNGEA